MIVLLQPPSNGLVSGGYLYNRNVSTSSGIRSFDAPVGSLGATLNGLPANTEAVVLDGLYFDDPRACRTVARYDGCAKVGLVHYLPPELPELSKVERQNRLRRLSFACSSVDALIATSHYVSRYLRRLGTDRVRVVQPGVSEHVIADRRRRSWPPRRILTVSALTKEKGYRLALEALSRVSRKRWQWEIIGDTKVAPDFVESFRNRVQRLGLESKVLIRGSRPPGSIGRHLAESDLFLFPSLSEAYGIACAEAVANALPVAAFGVGGVREVIERGRTGLLCAQPGVSCLARIVDTYFRRRSVYESIARATWRVPEVRLWDRCASEFERAVREVLP